MTVVLGGGLSTVTETGALVPLTPPAEAMLAQGIDAPSEESGAYQISPPIAGLLDATDDIRHHESDAPRREYLSHVLSG